MDSKEWKNPPSPTPAGLTLDPEQVLASKRHTACLALLAAERSWYDYAASCDTGPARTHAIEMYERIRNVRYGA